jgi:hypothetical protein
MTAGVFGSAILEVAIGILFLYFLLSSICSSINEIVATAMKWRAKNLENTLVNLLADPELLKQVRNHPLITAMGPRPSYLASTTFSLALLHSLAGGDGSMNISRARDTAVRLSREGGTAAKQRTGQALVALIDATRDPQGEAEAIAALKKRVEDGLLMAPPSSGVTQLRQQLIGATSLAGVQQAIETLPDGPPKVWAQGVVERARTDVDAATYKLEGVRQRIELWFDNAMDRTSGVYKRRTLVVIAIVALLLTAITGADSVNFVSRLYVDSALRAQLTQQAGQSQGQIDISKAATELEPLATLFGYADYPGAASPDLLRWTALKIAGEIVTVFALMLGAPFWFDLLTNVVNLRGSGPPPASSADAERARSSGRVS